MATADEIMALRRAINEMTNEEPYTDAYLGVLIDAEGSTDKAAASVWTTKAAQYSSLVDMTESGSSRRLSQLMENALKMAKSYRDGDTEPAPIPETGRSYTVQVERP